MDDQLLDAICDRLKPMLFIMRGTLESTTTDGGRMGFFNSDVLKGGEELLTWALLLDPTSGSTNLPTSTRTVNTLSEVVEGFALRADHLRFMSAQYRRFHSKQLQHSFRFY
jgi:cyclic nucleotide gated channel